MGFFDTIKNAIGKVGSGVAKGIQLGRNVIGKANNLYNDVKTGIGKVANVPILGDTLKTLYNSTPVGDFIKKADSTVQDVLNRAGGTLNRVEDKAVDYLDKGLNAVNQGQKYADRGNQFIGSVRNRLKI